MTGKEKIGVWTREVFSLPDIFTVHISETGPGSGSGQCPVSTEIRIMLDEVEKSRFSLNMPAETVTKEEIVLLHDSIEKSVKSSFISRNVYRFFGWWMIFAGSFTLFSVCPVCGQAGCVGSLGFTAVISALLALLKNFSSRIKDYFRKE